MEEKKILLLSNAGTLAVWIFFLIALFLPKENSFSVNSVLLGTFVITLPLLVLFLVIPQNLEQKITDNF
jgi:MFS transporter, DHA1 family, tetracycline resistance protein